MLMRSKGARIHFDCLGDPEHPTVCFVHSLATDGGMWSEQVGPLLRAGYRVLRVDLRGHGGSDPLSGDYTMYSLADDVADVLNFLHLARVHYVGLSIGGMIGQAFGVKHGDRAASLILCRLRTDHSDCCGYVVGTAHANCQGSGITGAIGRWHGGAVAHSGVQNAKSDPLADRL